jgi:hypothetical protein
MANIYGILGIEDRAATVDSIGQRTIYDAIQQVAAAHAAEMVEAQAAFVEGETTEYKDTYTLPAGGMMQNASPGSQRGARPGATKPVNSYDVSFPLEDIRDQIAWDDIALAYATLEVLNNAITGVADRHTNSVRYMILRALLNKDNETWKDPRKGDLTLRRLANGDGTLYNPVIGSTTEADDTHYLVSGYAASAISDTNNPYTTIRDEIEEHFGRGQIVVFINKAQRVKTEALTDFVPVTQLHVQPGDTVSTVIGVPQNVPGRLLGTINDAWVVQWDFIPANYMLGIDLNQSGPLKRRVDIPASLRGFSLIATQQEFPLQESFWRDRLGFAVANRLNGVAMFLDPGGSYTNPAAYA